MAIPSLLEYDRFHGLAENHLTQDPLVALKSCEDCPLPNELTGLSELSALRTGDVLKESRPQLTKSEEDLLARCIALPGRPEWKNFLTDHHRIRDLKLELPILAARLGPNKGLRGLELGEKLILEALPYGLEFADEDVANYCELTSQNELHKASDDYHREIATERISTTRGAICSLQRVVKDKFTQEMKDVMFKELLTSSRRSRPSAISPPLMPTEMSSELCFSSSPALRFTPCSETTDLDSPLRRDLLHELMAKDEIGIGDVPGRTRTDVKEILCIPESVCDLDTREEILKQSIDSGALKRHDCLQDLKPNVLLSPPDTEHRLWSWRKKVKFANGSGELISDTPETTESLFDAIEDDLNEELMKLAERASKETEQQIQNETINAPSLTEKLKIPALQSFGLKTPWAKGSQNLTDEFIVTKLAEEVIVQTAEFNREDDLRLTWVPFLAKWTNFSLAESIKDEFGYLAKTITAPTKVMRSGQLLWRLEKMRLFNDDDDSEEEDMAVDESLTADSISAQAQNQPIEVTPLTPVS